MENYEQPIYEEPVYEQPTYQQPSYQSHQKPAREKKQSGVKPFVAGFVGALVACLLFFGATSLFGGGHTVLGSSSVANIAASETAATLPEAVASKCLPSVVSVTVYSKQSAGYGSLLDLYFGGSSKNSDSAALQESSLGSGVVLSQDGYIITNNHVVEGADALTVTIEGEQYDATLVGTDASSDVAVIKVTNANGKQFTPIELGDSDNLTIGEWVMTIGNPFGLEQSVATGIVSATNRSQVMDSSGTGMGGSPTVYANMIQTDAAINPGNSGGALVNAQGQLIGINTLITSYSGNYSGVGFAIPINYALGLAKDIIDGKTPSHAQLGVSTTTITSSLAKRYGFSVNEGAYVSIVSKGSAAEKAGVQEGDIITQIDGTKVSSSSDVMLAVRSKNIGDTVEITVNRDGKTQTLKATLGSDASK